jgi:hypothetical protein
VTNHRYLAAVACGVCICAVPALSADAPIGADLKAAIALQGKPCDQVITSKRNSDSDYTVICKDGNRYHVFVNPRGQVVIEKQASLSTAIWTDGLS